MKYVFFCKTYMFIMYVVSALRFTSLLESDSACLYKDLKKKKDNVLENQNFMVIWNNNNNYYYFKES